MKSAMLTWVILPAVFLAIGFFAFRAYSQSKNSANTLAFAKNQQKNASESQAVPELEFTYEELAKYNGKDKPEIYLSVKHIVFDVSSSDAYAPGKSYHVFAGKDCTVALAKMSFEEEFMNAYIGSRLTSDELANMEQWADFIKNKYPVVGKIRESKKDH